MGDLADASRNLQCNSRLAKDFVYVQHRPYRLDIRDNEKVFVIDSGQPVTWGTQLIAHGKDVVYYQWHLDGVVAKVDRITSQLPAGVRVRIEVVVRHPVALEVGDEILGDGVRLGYVAAFVDDGATVPRVSFDGYHPTTGHQLTVGSRARAVMSARAVGPYDRIKQESEGLMEAMKKRFADADAIEQQGKDCEKSSAAFAAVSPKVMFVKKH